MTSNLCLSKDIDSELRALPGNNICCDCDDKNPQWASVSFGIFMCLECSGRHRSLGVHISFVRSVTMDGWNDKQIALMRAGGNARCIDFLNKYAIQKTTDIVRKYNSKAAISYKEQLEAIATGRQRDLIVQPLSEDVNIDDANNSGAKKQVYGSGRMGGGLGSASYNGIGSDGSSYSRAPPEPATTVDIDEIKERVVAVTREVGMKAFSFISTFIANDAVTGSSSSSKGRIGPSDDSNKVNPVSVQEHLAKGWSSAVSIWNQGLQVASDNFKDIVEGDAANRSDNNNDRPVGPPVPAASTNSVSNRSSASSASAYSREDVAIDRLDGGGDTACTRTDSSLRRDSSSADQTADQVLLAELAASRTPSIARRSAEEREKKVAAVGSKEVDFFADFGL